MKFKIIAIFFIFFTLFCGANNASAAITANAVVGNWTASGSWSGNAVPTSADDVIIPSGATITIDGTYPTCKTITVQNGGKAILNPTTGFYVGSIYVNNGGRFYGNGSYSSGNKTLYLGALNTNASISSLTYAAQAGDFYITVDGTGQFGGTAAGANDGIQIFFGELATNYTIDGTSTSVKYISRLMANNTIDQNTSTNFNFNIKQNLYISLSSAVIGLSLHNNKKFIGTRTMTIYPSYSVTGNSNLMFNNSTTTPTNDLGNIVYNIYGTLDLATNSTTYFNLYNTSFASSTQNITVNVGNGTDNAVLKLGRNINLKRYSETQSINLNWNNPNSKIVFGGNGSHAISCSGYYSGGAYVDDARIFPSSIRNLSYENIGATAELILPVKVTVTETLERFGNTYRVYAGQVANTTARTVTMGKLFYMNNNAYIVTAVSTPLTTVTDATLTAAGTWVKGATLTDGSGNSYYCDEFGLTAGSVNISGTGTVSPQITGGAIHVTGNVNSTLSGLTAYFPYATIDGNVTNGAGTLSFSKSSMVAGNLTNAGTLSSSSGASITVAGTLTNDGTVTVGSSLTTGALLNNGTVSFGANTLTINGALSGSGTINASTGTLAFGGTSEQTIDAANLASGSINNLTVNAGSKLTTSGTITASAINILSSASGTGTLINGGTLTNTNASVQQYLPDTRNWYVSSPVTAAVAPAGFTYYQRDETASSWVSQPFLAGDTFEAGKGYIALPGAAASTIQFSGTLNNGIVNTTLTKSGTGFNLIGNPYPSHLTWTAAFVDDVTNAALIEPTIWVRTNAGNVNSGGNADWKFLTYNGHSGEVVPLSANLTGGIIPPMQAFWVKAKESGTLTLDSKLTRSHQSSNPLKAPAVKKSDRQRIRLEISNGTTTDETLMYFDGDASNAFDAYDSPKFAETKDVQVYTTVGTEKLVINGLSTITDNLLIPLGIKASQAGTFTLKPIQLDNMTSDTKVYLVDGQSQTELELNKEYTFTSDATDNSSRFSLLFKAPSLTTQIENIANKPAFNVYRNTNGLLAVTIYETLNSTSKLTISNQLGQKLSEKTITENTSIINEPLTAGVYFVTVSSKGKNKTQKVVIN